MYFILGKLDSFYPIKQIKCINPTIVHFRQYFLANYQVNME